MTYDEVTKTLDCCSNAECWDCPYMPKTVKKGTFGCMRAAMKEASNSFKKLIKETEGKQ
jgi:hypothetical protein